MRGLGIELSWCVQEYVLRWNMLFRTFPTYQPIKLYQKEEPNHGVLSQAVLAAYHLIDFPFAVINADDYHGKEAFI